MQLLKWLTKQLTLAEAEAKYSVQDDRLGESPLPFGFQSNEWSSLVAKIQEGDELWEFKSPPEHWKKKRGRAGIALVRDGELIDSLVTLMN